MLILSSHLSLGLQSSFLLRIGPKSFGCSAHISITVLTELSCPLMLTFIIVQLKILSKLGFSGRKKLIEFQTAISFACKFEATSSGHTRALIYTFDRSHAYLRAVASVDTPVLNT